MRFSTNFVLSEFVRVPLDDVPAEVIENLERLVLDVLEPARVAMGSPIIVTSGYRSKEHNALVGGAPTSDHLTGNAADVYAAGNAKLAWDQNTIRLARWIREHRSGLFGQLILEDHRAHARAQGRENWSRRLWLHVSNTTPRHPGGDESSNRLLVSFAPRSFRMLEDQHLTGDA